MITVAIVGFGLSGRYLQAPFFLTNPHFRLKTIVSGQQNPSDVYPSVRTARSIEAVLDDPEIDLVSVASPNATHFDYAQRCLRAGKHVLVEKPFTATVAEAETLIALAKECGKHLFVFQNRRFDSDFLTVKKIVEGGFVGDVLAVDILFNRYKPILNPKKWKEEAGPASGIMYDLGAHIIDQSIALFGRPLSIAGETFTQRAGSNIDDAFDIRLDYGTLKVTLRSSLLVREDTPRYVLHGTHGSFVKYGIDQQEDQLKAGWWPTHPQFGTESVDNQGILNSDVNGLHFRGRVETLTGSWKTLFQNIHDVITEGVPSLIPLDDIVEQIRIMEFVKNNSSQKNN